MQKTVLALVLATGLSACATPQTASGGLAADEKLCAAIEAGANGAANLAACSRVIENADDRGARVLAYNRRGIAQRDAGREAEALADFNAAIRLAPMFSAAYTNRGTLYSAQGKDALAVQSFQAAIRANPDNPSAYNTYSWHLVSRGDYEGALTQVNRSLAVDDQRESSFDTQGHALMGLGQATQAEAAFNRAMELGGAEVVRLYQKALSDKGYDPGGRDGEVDARMRAGLEACIRDNCGLLLD